MCLKTSNSVKDLEISKLCDYRDFRRGLTKYGLTAVQNADYLIPGCSIVLGLEELCKGSVTVKIPLAFES